MDPFLIITVIVSTVFYGFGPEQRLEGITEDYLSRLS